MRRDFFMSSPETTNNRMALSGAIELLHLVGAGGTPPAIFYHSDSQYLVNGITDWVHNWERNGWRRKAGAVQNLELWQRLLPLSRIGKVRWRWVRGHAGNVKNEYADHLAVRAAEMQSASRSLVESELPEWLARQQSKGKFSEYDPDAHFERLAKRYTTEE